ncbi:MAG: thioesterase family protein [Planctomycetota bacterium]
MTSPTDALRAPDQPIPTRGEQRIRVRYNECDPMGVAHHASYVAWLEIGRTELLRTCGVTYADMERAGVLLVVTKVGINYKAPARYDDEIVVITNVAGGGRARIDHAYELWLDRGDGHGRSLLLATATSTLACVGMDKRPQALPEWLRAAAHVDD